MIAFPQAHGEILTTLYLPVTFMLIGLILRGVAFDFRVKAGDKKKPMWNNAFFLGSVIASCSLIKTEDELFEKALYWARAALAPMALGLFLISIATPIVSDVIAARWFVMPNLIGLTPIPVFSLIILAVVYWLLKASNPLVRTIPWAVFVSIALICILATMGLAYSIYPDIIIGRMTIWEAASDEKSLDFVLVGLVITLHMILGYTVFVYRVFSGKATKLRYD